MASVNLYRNGGLGFGRWVEDNVCLPVYPPGSVIPEWTPVKDLSREPNPETRRSYWDMWCEQKRIAEECLALDPETGRFVYRVLVFCWMRGEGKSLFVCLLQLWKFFNWPKQLIVLGANSKDQSKFVHFDIMTSIILNSPKLLSKIGTKNIQEKEIRIRDGSGNVASSIRSISSFSGIVSNITGYTFSEIFDLKNHKFFYQLDGSIRNIPMALGTIDSTVSDKTHPLYKLYDTWKKKKDPTLYFSHRQSDKGDAKDFWNPMMTQIQLDSYRNRFPDVEFAQYFKNTWEAGQKRVFTDEMIEATHYIGMDSQIGLGIPIIEQLTKITRLGETKKKMEETMTNLGSIDGITAQQEHIRRRLIPIEEVYTLKTPNAHPRMADLRDMENLTNTYDTDWMILAGIDRSDPMKKQWAARTILTVIAKGLPGSRSRPEMYYDETVKKYIYFLLYIAHIETASLSDIKGELVEVMYTYNGIDVMGAERWGMWDIGDFCEENNIIFEPVFPTYDKQRDAFSELYTLYKTGMFKAPSVAIAGAKSEDILEEEARNFDHDPIRRWYGSVEKQEKYGVQDDCMFSLAWGVYSGRNYGVEYFREMREQISFGEFHTDKTLHGEY